MKASKGLGPPIEVIGLSVIQAGTFLTKVKSPAAHSVEWTICNLHDKSKHKFSPQVQQLRQQQQQQLHLIYISVQESALDDWVKVLSLLEWPLRLMRLRITWAESVGKSGWNLKWSLRWKDTVLGSRGGADDFCPNDPTSNPPRKLLMREEL